MASPSRGAKPSRWSASFASFSVAVVSSEERTRMKSGRAQGGNAASRCAAGRLTIESGIVLENNGRHPNSYWEEEVNAPLPILRLAVTRRSRTPVGRWRRSGRTSRASRPTR
jgi:hypothetical protein